MKKLLLLLILLIVSIPVFVEAQNNSNMTITSIDCAVEGESILLESDGEFLLMDTCVAVTSREELENIGAENVLISKLKSKLREKNTNSLDIYISHYHSDHYGLLKTILDDTELKINKIYLPKEPFNFLENIAQGKNMNDIKEYVARTYDFESEEIGTTLNGFDSIIKYFYSPQDSSGVNLIPYAKSKGMFVITDAKRNDIGTTMEAYANAHLGITDVDGESFSAFGADALTVNGYLGSDGIKPVLSVSQKMDTGMFVLVKTSNPSSGELQNLTLSENDETIYFHMGKLCEEWGNELSGKYGYSGVGAVVGATYPEQLTELRKALPHTFFLVPGYGAQGGTADDIAGAFDKNGLGAVVNSSRGIMCAWQKETDCKPEDFALAARREALKMKKLLTDVTGKITLP